jgi:hypothetical protein
MGSPYGRLFEASVAAIAAEAERVVQAFRVGTIRDEEDFSSQFLATIRAGLGPLVVQGIEWDSAVLRKQTEEPALGADFAGVLRLRLGSCDVDKGFLAQASTRLRHMSRCSVSGAEPRGSRQSLRKPPAHRRQTDRCPIDIVDQEAPALNAA